MYLVPVDNHKRWEQLQQQTKTGPDSSSYNSEEISKHKQNDLSKCWIAFGSCACYNCTSIINPRSFEEKVATRRLEGEGSQ